MTRGWGHVKEKGRKGNDSASFLHEHQICHFNLQNDIQTEETGLFFVIPEWVFLWSGYFMFDRWITSEISYMFVF